MKTLLYLIITGALISILLIFFPVLRVFTSLTTAKLMNINYEITQELNPLYSPDAQTRILKVPKTDFWMAIPKLGVISTVQEGVNFLDPYSQKDYVSKNLLIHSLDSAKPGQWGTMIISAHHLSETNWPGYNPSYYFAGRLSPDQEIIVGYEGEKYTYKVISTKTVESLPDMAPDFSSPNLLLLVSNPFISGAKREIRAVLAN